MFYPLKMQNPTLVGQSARRSDRLLTPCPRRPTLCVSPPVFRIGFIGRYARCPAKATLPKARWACSLRFRHSVRERNLPGGSSKSVRRSLAPSVFRPCPTKRPLVTSLPKYLHGDSACGWRCRPLRSRHYSEYVLAGNITDCGSAGCFARTSPAKQPCRRPSSFGLRDFRSRGPSERA